MIIKGCVGRKYDYLRNYMYKIGWLTRNCIGLCSKIKSQLNFSAQIKAYSGCKKLFVEKRADCKFNLTIYYTYSLQMCRNKFVEFKFCFTSFFVSFNQLLKINSSTLKQVSYHYFHWWMRRCSCLFKVFSLSDIYVRMSLAAIIRMKYECFDKCRKDTCMSYNTDFSTDFGENDGWTNFLWQPL